MRKPTKLQYFYACPWIGLLWFIILPVVLSGWVGYTCLQYLNPLHNWQSFLLVTLCILISFLLGFFLSLFPGCLIIGPLSHYFAIKNGGPFKEGDTVRILGGVHKDKITRVYSLWQHGTVRVELGQKEKEEYRDIYGPDVLFREDNLTPSGSDPN